MPHPLWYTIDEIEGFLRKGAPYPVEPSLDLIYPSAGYVDSGNIKTTREPLALPGSMLLQVFPEACSRHATLGALLRGYRDRVWLLKLQESDLVTGGYIRQVEQAAEEMIQSQHPQIIALCGTCIDQLLGSDYDSLAAKLEKRWNVRFCVVCMEPIMKDRRLPFKAKDLRAIHSVIRSKPGCSEKPWVNLIGRAVPPPRESELRAVLGQAGIERVLHFSDASSLDELDDMSRVCLNIGIEERAKLTCDMMEQRYHIPYVLLESSLVPRRVHENYQRLSRALCTALDDSAAAESVNAELRSLLPRLQGLKIAVGEHIQRRPFAAAAELAELGFPIDCVFTLSLQAEDLPAVEQLHAVCPRCRVYFSGTPEILSYCRKPESFDLVLGLNAHYYARTAATAAVSVDVRHGDYHSILSFLREVSAALDQSRTGTAAHSLFSGKNVQDDQQNLRSQIRMQAEQRAEEMALVAWPKQWGVCRREET